MFKVNSKKNPSTRPRFKQVKNSEELMSIAIYHLSIKDYMIGELRAKLVRNVVEFNGDGDALVDGVISKLKEMQYLKDDLEFGKRFAYSSFSNEYGIGYVRSQLLKKGMPRPVIDLAIDETLGEYQFDFFTSAVNRLLNKYNNGFNGTSSEQVRKTLIGWGFSSSESKHALDNHPQSHELRSKVEIKGSKADLTKEVLKLAKKMKGVSIIRMELMQKKVPLDGFDDLIQKLSLSGELDFFESAKARLAKKRYDLSDRKGSGAAYSHLASNGFSSEQIKYAIEELRCEGR